MKRSHPMIVVRRRHPRARTWLATAAVSTVVLTGCTTGTSSETPPDRTEVVPGLLAVADTSFGGDGELVVQVDYDTAEASGLDPQGAEIARSWMLGSLSYETLTTIDENLDIAPSLATSWETPSDTVYVFTLAEDAVFSNGRAMTAADVVGSLQRLLENPTTWTGQLGPIESIEQTGDLEVTITLSRPYTPLLAALANTPAAVLPMAEIQAGDVDIETEMLGTGPFVATSHRQDEEWTFAINEHHRDADDIGFSSLTIDIVGDEATRAAALRDGAADFAVLNSIDSAQLLANAPGVNVVGQRNSDFHYLMINSLTGDEALQDEDVRFALNSAIDRSAINELAFGGSTAPTGVTPTVLDDACNAVDLPASSHDVAAAKATIDDIGGLDLDLIVYTDEPVLAQIAQVIQQNLTEIGVATDIQQVDTATYVDRVYGDPAQFDLALSWFAGYADPSMVTTWWNPRVAGFSASFSQGSEELDSLIAEGYATAPGSDRAEVFERLCAVADQHSEMIPLVLRPSTIGWNTATLSPTLSSDEGYGNFLRHILEFRAQ